MCIFLRYVFLRCRPFPFLCVVESFTVVSENAIDDARLHFNHLEPTVTYIVLSRSRVLKTITKTERDRGREGGREGRKEGESTNMLKIKSLLLAKQLTMA